MKRANSGKPSRPDRRGPSELSLPDIEEVACQQGNEYVDGNWPPLKIVVDRSKRRLLPPRR